MNTPSRLSILMLAESETRVRLARARKESRRAELRVALADLAGQISAERVANGLTASAVDEDIAAMTADELLAELLA